MQNRLRFLRAEQNWSQAELAERLDVSRQTVNALEVGKYDPSLPLAFKIAQLFRCPIETIFFLEERFMYEKSPYERYAEQIIFFERYTEKAVQAIKLAQEEGAEMGHQFVGTEQILLGLIKQGTGIAGKVLKSMGINLDDARSEVEKIIGRGQQVKGVEFPFTPLAKFALDFSLEESRQLKHDFVGTEHLLLGLLRVTDGVGARVLQILGVNLQELRQQVLREIEIMLPKATSTPIATSHTNQMKNTGYDLGNSPIDFTSGEISARFCALLFSWVEPRKLGHIVGASAGFQLPDGDVVAPKISFFSRERVKRVPRTYPELAPDLVVEIKSAFDKLASLQEKIRRFLDLGAKIGLLIDPDERTVAIYNSSSEFNVFGESDKLTIPTLLPGWELSVFELWPPVFE
ncbi:MAG: Uma2 family endonuclease [Desmonostoc vinosum HA7617-LM4]|jgi:DNA-binding XRE family transcriptional regulator/Uma2 family endonuclease|nr:Uma2 family endonuclease [Desmonostoc vinosum HA7617-LM4]